MRDEPLTISDRRLTFAEKVGFVILIGLALAFIVWANAELPIGPFIAPG